VSSSLRGYATAVVSTAVAAGRGPLLVSELAAVTDLVSRPGDLAVALTDVGVPVAARRSVLEELLGNRVAPETLRVVLRAVGDERADELVVGLEDVSELARHLVELGTADVRAVEDPLGRTAWRKFVVGYADAIFELVPQVSDLEAIELEIYRFARVVENSPTLRAALADLSRTIVDRQAIVTQLLDGKAQSATAILIRLVLEGRARDVVGSIDWLVELAARARGWRVARVRSASTMDADGRDRLAKALSDLVGKPVELQIELDETLIGGVTVEIGDLLVDASAAHRLAQLQEHLLGTEGALRAPATR
jgi:F-type H+-transporting ATPase subunit delta